MDFFKYHEKINGLLLVPRGSKWTMGGGVWQEQRARDGLPPLPAISPVLEYLPEEVPLPATCKAT